MESEILEQLYIAHHRAAYLYTLSLCGDHHLASDIVADAFVKAYLSLPDHVPSFRYWLLRVCKNLWLDQLRRRKLETNLESPERISDGNTPENAYIQNETYQTLWRIISSLPPADRELLTLHYFSRMPLQDIAPIMGKSYAAVRQRMVRLRQHMKLRMEEQGYGK